MEDAIHSPVGNEPFLVPEPVHVNGDNPRLARTCADSRDCHCMMLAACEAGVTLALLSPPARERREIARSIVHGEKRASTWRPIWRAKSTNACA
jgi:hypothetical protein